MCGIAGFVLSHPWDDCPELARDDRPELKARLTAMGDRLRHRGPDDDGLWTDGRAGLVHRRLAVIDCSPAGRQPMVLGERVGGDGPLVLVFNGEIYNFRELRQDLESKGYRFRGRSDTEVLLNGYAAWGEAVFPRLRGMFAVAIWDGRRLVLARDPVGKKPLYYGRCGEAFLFASEVKAALTWPGVRREANLEAIHHYLSLQYVPGPGSAFRGFSRLPAGHTLTVAACGSERLCRYAALPSPRQARPRPEAELVAELRAGIETAVRRRMIADVPLGAFLSGGVDSSAVVATMARLSDAPVKTFTIGFHDDGYDERPYARMVAERYGTEHHELVVEPDVAALVPVLAWHYGEPYADSSAIPTYCLAEMTRQHVTVALNGDGGDESLLGYRRYQACRPPSLLDWLPHAGRRGLAALFGDALPLDSRRYEPNIGYFYDRAKAQGYAAALRPFLARSSLDLLEPFFAAAPDMVTGAAWADLHTYLPDDLLVKVDIATMAHGLEARSPLLDQDLMTWAARVPAQQKMKGGELKYLLKKAMEPDLPQEILYRPKMGFGIPLDRWLRGPLKPLAQELILSARARERGLFAPDFSRFLFERHLTGQSNLQNCLWAMIMLEQWFRTWIDG